VTVLSSPTPTKPERLPEKRALIPSKITSESQLESVIAGLEADGGLAAARSSVLLEFLEAIVPSPAIASIPDAISSVASVYAAYPTDFVRSAFDLVINGLTPSDPPVILSRSFRDSLLRKTLRTTPTLFLQIRGSTPRRSQRVHHTPSLRTL
jgi:hypothetical protein